MPQEPSKKRLSKAKTEKLDRLMEQFPDHPAVTYGKQLLDWANDGTATSDPPTPPGGPPNP